MTPQAPRADPAPPRPVDLAAVERELVKLWEVAGQGADGTLQVTRACMSNLILYGTSREQAERLPDEVDVLVRHHPSRVLLLVGDDRGEDAIEAEISARCYMAGPKRRFCSEMVTIRAAGGAVRRLPSAARSLLIGDLPTTLWWAGDEAPPLGGALFDELMAMSDQLIYSSENWPDPARGTLAIADWAGAVDPDEPDIADLSWGALKPWRRLISQSLAPDVLPGALASIARVEVEYRPPGLPQAWLLAGWLASRLGWAPGAMTSKSGGDMAWSFRSMRGPVEVRFRAVPGDGDGDEGGVGRATVSWPGEAGPASMSFERVGPGRLAATGRGLGAEGEPRVLTMPTASRARRVAAELKDLELDLPFREALRASRALAQAVLHS